MKKIIMFAMAMLVACSSVFAQDAKEIRYWEKKAKKQAKILQRDGWSALPTAMPIEEQLKRSYLMESQKDEYGFPKFVMGTAVITAEHHRAAKNTAKLEATSDIVSQIQIAVTALFESKVGNQELSPEDATSLSDMVMGAQAFISKNLEGAVTVQEYTRVLDNKNVQLTLQIAYSEERAKQAVKEAVKEVTREELGQKGEELIEKLDVVLGL